MTTENKIELEDVGVDTCPYCFGDNVCGNSQEDIDPDDYDDEEDYEDACFDMCDYECIECQREWNLDELEEIRDIFKKDNADKLRSL